MPYLGAYLKSPGDGAELAPVTCWRPAWRTRQIDRLRAEWQPPGTPASLCPHGQRNGAPAAQKIQTLFIDDLDGSEAEGTVRFGLDGADYEIDLSAKNAAAPISL